MKKKQVTFSKEVSYIKKKENIYGDIKGKIIKIKNVLRYTFHVHFNSMKKSKNHKQMYLHPLYQNVL